MSVLALGLILVSTVMHAGWNLLARRGRSEAAFFRRMLIVIAVVGAIPAIWCELRDPRLNPVVLAYAAGSGVCCGLYYLFLMLGYKASDFTVVYPVARALPVLAIGLLDVARQRHPSAVGWAGMALVVAGCLLAPHTSFRGLTWRPYVSRSSLWIVLTALGTVGYTMLDKFAAEILPAGPLSAMVYGYVFFVVSYVVYELMSRLSGVRDGQPAEGNPGGGRAGLLWFLAFLGAVMNYGSYALVLWVYQMCEHASYIVACRQFSIVIGVVLAFVIYHEKGVKVRLVASALITAGLVLISLGG